MSCKHNYTLSIAGFDPSSGAGITSDIKTFEAFGLYGLSICTTITVQNDINFKTSHWLEPELIIHQLETLFERFDIGIVKIGLIENWEVLRRVVERLMSFNPDIKIILDPILNSSSGFQFHSTSNQQLLSDLLEDIFMITPNYQEIQLLYPTKSIAETIKYLRTKTNIYLKGGHRPDKKGWDELFYKNGTSNLSIAPQEPKVFEKHGSGCVLSAALAASLHFEKTIEQGAYKAKTYTEMFLNSNQGLLGCHTYKPYE